MRLLVEGGADKEAKDAVRTVQSAHNTCTTMYWSACLFESISNVSIDKVSTMYSPRLQSRMLYNILQTWNELTALIWAAEKGHTACARLLLELGADKEAKNIVRSKHKTFCHFSINCAFLYRRLFNFHIWPCAFHCAHAKMN